jgi:xylulokinase
MKNTESAACLGAAILAGVGAKVWDGIAHTAERFAQSDLEYTPDPKNKAAYDRMLDNYKKLLGELSASFGRA